MTDTSPEAEAVRLRVIRSLSPGQRLLLATGWSQSLRDLIRANLRVEYPDASEARLFRLFVDRWLGPELAAKAYGPLEPHG